MTEYNRFDLKEVAEELGNQFSKRDAPGYTQPCIVCGEPITQREDRCPVCNTPVVWFSSPTWRELYGSPKVAAELLEMVQPTTVTGDELCTACGVDGFRNASEEQMWAKAERSLGKNSMRNIIRFVTDKKGRRGRAGMSFALNIARKRYAERPKNVRQEEVKQNKTSMW